MPLQAKVFEFRDSATFIPILAIGGTLLDCGEAEQYLLRRLGYSDEQMFVYLIREGMKVTYDPNQHSQWYWSCAHQHLLDNWPHLKGGEVIDVQFLSGKASTEKRPERLEALDEVKKQLLVDVYLAIGEEENA